MNVEEACRVLLAAKLYFSQIHDRRTDATAGCLYFEFMQWTCHRAVDPMMYDQKYARIWIQSFFFALLCFAARVK